MTISLHLFLMKHILFISIILTVLYSCQSAKGMDNNKQNSSDTQNETSTAQPIQKISEKEMLEKGFKKGAISTSKSEGCLLYTSPSPRDA